MTSTRNLDPYRLPTSVVPRRYDLVLEPDLETSTFQGSVRIRLEVLEPVDEIVLNAKELELGPASLHSTQGDVLGAPEIRLEPDPERVFFVPGRRLAPGVYDLSVAFRGPLNDKLAGFYRSTFLDGDGKTHAIATTQLQATDARRAFPCFDEPAFKAVFGITLLVPEGLFAVSNSPVASEEDADGGRRRIRFADTPPMSTYLVAFVVGPLEATEPVDVDGVPLRVVHPRGKGHLTRYALEAGAFALRHFSEYYGIPYPAAKLDLVAVPDFAFGAMENLGCVTFREVLLLVDEARSTEPELLRVADVIAHEIAHMWFGDLVTMRWWNGTWLNEAFATFMATACTDAFRPAWRRWDQFNRERSAAFDVDALQKSRPIEIEVRSPADAEAMFDVLTYEKGASVLRMLEQYLGENRFRNGVRHYLRRHAYGNTETSDLWDAIEEIAGEPVRRTMHSWIFQPGFPLVSVAAKGESAVEVRQERFFYRRPEGDSGGSWSVPLLLRSGGGAPPLRALLDGRAADLPISANAPWILANAGGHGFYRVRYSADLLSRLAAPLMSELSAAERYALADDCWAAMLAGLTPAPEFLALGLRFGAETDLDVWTLLIGCLEALERLLEGEPRQGFHQILRSLLVPALARLGTEPRAGEPPRNLELRGLLTRTLAGTAEDPDALARCRDLHGMYLRAPDTVEPNLAAASAAAVAFHGSTSDYETFLSRFRGARTPQEEGRYRSLLAAFPRAGEMSRTLGFTLDGTVRTQDAPYLLAACLNNRDNGPIAWEFVKAHWSRLLQAFPDNAVPRMLSGVRALSRPDTAGDVLTFFEAHAVPKGQRALEQHLEKLRVNVALREREVPGLEAFVRRS